ILAIGPIARRDVKDAESDERSAAFYRELRHAELPRAHGVRRKGNPEHRERRIAKLPRAVRGEGGERDDAQGDHCRVDQMRSATIKTVASQTPARCSKIAKAPELTVTARSSTRNPATPAGTGSAAHTMRCNRDTKTSRSGSTGRTRHALIARARAPSPTPSTPANVQTLVVSVAMYARCGGIHTLSASAAKAAPTRTNRPAPNATGVPAASATQSVPRVTSCRATSH